MRDPLVQEVKEFLEPRLIGQKPVLLGYSGGPDSKALLYLLMDCRAVLDFELCLVHVDHGWREESRHEAELIAKEAECLGLKWRSCRLETHGMPVRNPEAAARAARFEYFQKIYDEMNAQALLLAHQADDQAETILKRLLEGSHPMHWSGIEGEAKIDKMQIWRPLLNVTKKKLMVWLCKRGLTPFQDSSNLDPRFLRGRFRTQIIPSLAEQFGKEVSHNLCKAGQASSEIHQYLFRKCQPYWDRLKEIEGGMQWDLREVNEPLELKWLLKSWFEKENWHVSYESLQGLIDSLLTKQVNKTFSLKNGYLSVQFGILVYRRF